jgi:hypothetical protein
LLRVSCHARILANRRRWGAWNGTCTVNRESRNEMGHRQDANSSDGSNAQRS